MTQLIEVTVSPLGETRIETQGFAGAVCQLVTRALETALGQRSTETLTAEFYHSVSQEAGLEPSLLPGEPPR